MNQSEARKRAVEVARMAVAAAYGPDGCPVGLAVDAWERAMADAGWRMVRDVPLLSSDVFDAASPDSKPFRNGWNACRAAMMEGE